VSSRITFGVGIGFGCGCGFGAGCGFGVGAGLGAGGDFRPLLGPLPPMLEFPFLEVKEKENRAPAGGRFSAFICACFLWCWRLCRLSSALPDHGGW